MIITLFLKNKIFFSKLYWFLVLECHTLVWILEFEIEKFKTQNLWRKFYAWFKPYRVLTRNIISKIEVLNYTKFGAVWFRVYEFWFHFIRWLWASFLLTQSNLKSLYLNPLFYYFTRFFFIHAVRLVDTVIWSWQSDFFVKISRSKLTQNLEKYLSAVHKSKIHEDDTYEPRWSTVRLTFLDLHTTCVNWLQSLITNKLVTSFTLYLKSLKFYFIWVIVASVLTILLFKTFFYFNIFSHVWFNIAAIFLLYIFVSTYFHFSKTYRFNKYTSQNQRFWKRTFGAFWGLEFTLFIIYMYLTLISPAELATFGINHKEIITGINVVRNSTYHYIYFLVLLLINTSFVTVIYLKKRNLFHYANLFFIVILFSYCFIIYYEFLKLYYVAGWGAHSFHYANKSVTQLFEYNYLNNNSSNNELSSRMLFKVPNNTTTTWNEVAYEKQWLRTFRHFVYISIILKFWHIFFIFFYFTLSLTKYIETDYISFDTLSSNHQNAIYVIWFYLFSYLLIMKHKLYFLIAFVYYWSFTHVMFVDFIFCLFQELNINYLL